MKKTRKALRAVIAAGLCAAVAGGTAMPAWAADAAAVKDENIYATLEPDGSVSGIYVVNEFFSETGGELSDYGDYTSVTNLTDQSELAAEDGHITGELPQGRFYYQGNLASGELPWLISIRYFLDGEELTASELAGKSGSLRIIIETRQNPNGNEAFFDHYLLQATVVLSTERCTNIQAEGATEGNVGEDRQLVYTILPGQETEMEITAEVQSFEMDGITFQGVPMSLDISGDMLDDLDWSDQTAELTDAVAQLDDGVGELKEGTAAAASGGWQLAEAITELAEGAGLLNSGGSALAQGTSALSGGTKELQKGVNQYIAGVDSLAAGVEQYVAGVELLAQGGKLLAPLENLSLVDDAVTQLYQAVAVGDAQQGVPSLQAGAESLSDGLRLILEQVQLLADSTDMAQLEELLSGLEQIQSVTAQLPAQLEELSGILGTSAGLVSQVEASHQAVLDELNRQVSAANSDIASSVDRVNGQIEDAISAIRAAAEEGALDEGTAEQAIASLNGAKVDASAAAAIQMPQEDEQIRQTITTLNGVSGALKEAAAKLETAAQQLKLAADAIAANLPSAGSSGGMDQLVQALSAACDGADQLKTGVNAVGAALRQLSESTASFGEAGEGIAALNAGFDALCENNSLLLSGSQALIDAKEVLTEGLTELIAGTEELNSGAGTLAKGISTLHQGTSLLDEKTGELTSGLDELDEGTGKLKEGTEEFREQTGSIDEKLQEELDRLLDEVSGDDFEPVSFLSERNTNIGLVQFALTTGGIEIPEETVEAEPEAEEGFLDRLLNLFR